MLNCVFIFFGFFKRLVSVLLNIFWVVFIVKLRKMVNI